MTLVRQFFIGLVQLFLLREKFPAGDNLSKLEFTEGKVRLLRIDIPSYHILVLCRKYASSAITFKLDPRENSLVEVIIIARIIIV